MRTVPKSVLAAAVMLALGACAGFHAGAYARAAGLNPFPGLAAWADRLAR